MAPAPPQQYFFYGFGSAANPQAPPPSVPNAQGAGVQRYAVNLQTGHDPAWDYANLAPNEVQLLQQRLVNAGFASNLPGGVWDESSAKAMRGAMAAANRGNMTVDDVLNTANQNAPGGVGGSGHGGGSVGPEKRAVERPNLVTGGHTTELTAPQDIEKAAGDTFQKLLGRNIHADETLLLVQQIQNLDRMNQATKFGQEDATKSATFMQDMATANQRQAEAGASADQTLALHQQAQGAGSGTILPGANTSGMPVGGHQTQLPNAETTVPANPAAYAEWVVKTQLPNEYLGAQMAQRANQMGDFITKSTGQAEGPLTQKFVASR